MRTSRLRPWSRPGLQMRWNPLVPVSLLPTLGQTTQTRSKQVWTELTPLQWHIFQRVYMRTDFSHFICFSLHYFLYFSSPQSEINRPSYSPLFFFFCVSPPHPISPPTRLGPSGVQCVVKKPPVVIFDSDSEDEEGPARTQAPGQPQQQQQLTTYPPEPPQPTGKTATAEEAATHISESLKCRDGHGYSKYLNCFNLWVFDFRFVNIGLKNNNVKVLS